jgi:excisionase family DNA binding protein
MSICSTSPRATDSRKIGGLRHDEPHLYSIEEAGHILGCGRTLVYDLIKNGRLRTRKLGRLTKVTASDLNEFIRRLPSSQGGVK